jgi:hypothetical protein
MGSCLLTIRYAHPVLTCLRRLTILPLVYSICMTAIILLTHTLHGSFLVQHTLAALLVLALPFLLASLFAIPYILTHCYEQQARPIPSSHKIVLHIGMLVLITIYFSGQFSTYIIIALSHLQRAN